MTNQCIHEIWNLNTGIEDISEDPYDLFSSEILGITASWNDQLLHLRENQHLVDEFIEQLGREWAIETGMIENLYVIDRGVTLTLIEYGFKAEYMYHGSVNKPRGYVLKLLRDQKDSFDGLFDFIKGNRPLTTSYVKELHASLLRSHEMAEGIDRFGRCTETPIVKGDWKIHENFPVRNGIKYMYCPPEHVQSEMERLLQMHSHHLQTGISIEVQAAWLHHRFTQIHPFQDGNGRVARALASLIFLKHGLFPLIITTDDRPNYIQALEKADSGDLSPLVNIFVKSQRTQFKKASKIGVVSSKDIPSTDSALKILQASASAYNENQSKRKLLRHSMQVEAELRCQLDKLIFKIKGVLEQIHSSPSVLIQESDGNTDHYYRHQIINHADHCDYYANTDTYRYWIDLRMNWTHSARLVFSIHGIGKHINLEALMCSSFLYLNDANEEALKSYLPLTEDGFLFYRNEKPEQIKTRFLKWLDQVLSRFMIELSQNL